MILRPPKFNAYYDVMDVKLVNGATWRLEVSGLVADKRAWTLSDLQALPQTSMVIRLAARTGIREVYLQRLVFDDLGRGLARSESSLFEATQAAEEAAIAAAQELGNELGVTIEASGATEPGTTSVAKTTRLGLRAAGRGR